MAKYSEKYHSYKDKYEAWEYYLDYFSKSGYAPMSCCNFCPYGSQCNHEANMLLTARPPFNEIEKIEGQDIQYFPIEEVRRDIDIALFNSLRNISWHSIHVIKCQAGSGKSETMLRYLRRGCWVDNWCRIYVPTNKLKLEIYSRAVKKGIKIMMYPSLFDTDIQANIPAEAWDNIQILYNTGRGKKVTEYIEEYLGNHECEILEKYLIDKKTADNFEGHIITTHHNLLYSSNEKINRYVNIIDEDLLSTILCNHTTISVTDLENTLEMDNVSQNLKVKLKWTLKNIRAGIKFFKLPQMPCKNDIPNPLFDISLYSNAETFYSDGKNIYFINFNDFILNRLIILSATADKQIYEWYFGKDRIVFYDCKQSEFKGKLIQYPNMTMSRSYVKNNPGIYDRIESVLGEIPFISFKGKSRRTNVHMNNCKGHDELKGQDMAVIGTPHFPSWMYELIVYSMGFNVHDTMRPQVVEHNGYRFKFMTYSNEILRTIQFWLIGTELEQAIGRARLLNEDCTVHLFSNFPLRQAQLRRWVDI